MLDDGSSRYTTSCQTIQVIRYSLIVSNTLTWLVGLALIIVSLILLYDPSLAEVRSNLQLFGSYKAGVVVAICVGIGVCLLSLLGCCVSWHRSSKGLLVFNLLLLLLIIAEITLMVLVWKHSSTQKTKDVISKVIQDIIYRKKVLKPEATTFLDHVQERLQCCGGKDYEDYAVQEMDLPGSCFYMGAGHQYEVYENGCGAILVYHFNTNGLYIGLIALFILLLQIIFTACSCALYFNKRVFRKRIAESNV